MFLNLIMLAGIAGAAVPLVLHLLNRARYRTVDWGAMMFLFGDDPREQRSSRLKQWVILALRMALVALLAITLARPLLAAGWNRWGQDPVTAVILLDRSASMGYDENGHTRLDEAREAVRQILSTLRRGDQAALIALGDQTGRTLPPRLTSDTGALIDRLAGAEFLNCGFGVADMSEGLKTAADVFDRYPSGNRALYIVCDRQALNWDQADAKFAASWRLRTGTPGPAPKSFVILVGGEEADNVAVESISLASGQIIAGQSADVDVTVRNYGPTPCAGLPVTVRVGSSRTELKSTVNLAAKASGTVRVPVRLSNVGSDVITAHVESAGLSGDDSMSCAVDVVKPIDVLIVSGEAHRDRGLNQSDYLKLALMPFAAAQRSGADIASVQVVTPNSKEDWGDFDSGKYRVVILADVPEITPGQARALEQHVYGGGGLLVAPGNLTRIDNVNEMLYRDGAGILPAQLKTATPADGSASTTILGIDLSHPLFHFLKGKPDPIPSAVVARYFTAAVSGSAGRVLASFASGQPFVVEGKYGRGKVILVTSPLDGEWGTLPLTHFFLPLVQSAVRYLASNPSRNLHVGEAVVADFEDVGAAREATIRLPSGRQVKVPLQSGPGPSEVRYGPAEEPGVYTITVPSKPSLHYVVQSPHLDSDITPLPAPRWRQLEEQLGIRVIEPGTTPVAAALAEERSRRELWPVLLAMLLALAVVEIALERLWSRGGG